jgi:PEP-CTERM motif-containing protein
MRWSAIARSMNSSSVACSGGNIRHLGWGAAFCLALVSGQAWGQLLDTSDTAIGIDTNSVFGLNGRYPGAEGPANAVDQNPATKYLNFGREGSGLIITPFAPIPVESFRITTANDAPGRDPGSWKLFGFNGPLTTTDSGPSPAINQDGLAEAWTLIASGGLALPGDPTNGADQRGVVGPLVVINPGTPDAGYDHYKMIFPSVKDNTQGNVDSLQFADIQFYSDELGSGGSAFLAAGDPTIAVDEIRAWNGSSYPGGENPPKVLDQLSTTKYLNFGREGSGLIITNSGGPVTVGTMRLTTAGDAPNRDPATYELYGTNDPIQSVDNSNGLGGEIWTLISSGGLTLPAARQDSGTFVPINAATGYKSYKLIFPTLKNAPATNSMQIADVQFYVGSVPEPSTLALVVIGLAAVGLARRRD